MCHVVVLSLWYLPSSFGIVIQTIRELKLDKITMLGLMHCVGIEIQAPERAAKKLASIASILN